MILLQEGIPIFLRSWNTIWHLSNISQMTFTISIISGRLPIVKYEFVCILFLFPLAKLICHCYVFVWHISWIKILHLQLSGSKYTRTKATYISNTDNISIPTDYIRGKWPIEKDNVAGSNLHVASRQLEKQRKVLGR